MPKGVSQVNDPKKRDQDEEDTLWKERQEEIKREKQEDKEKES